ncbi:helix-turn-helix domain-containing protein [Streptacidiphilus albus]|uniref:helix-turn-helix domain-containing protein n=1 Tax=Streptacidiphilus albus TaxID=105425 RepID=UPI00054BA39A|nr:helix-turn-helix transcriptional regulator [Streptacidiphilus albus]
MEQHTTVRQRRTMPAEVGRMPAEARIRTGLRGNEAARLLGISAGYLVDLQTGRRCPSVTIAERLAEVLALEPEEREQLLAAAVDDTGRDNPLRKSA